MRKDGKGKQMGEIKYVPVYVLNEDITNAYVKTKAPDDVDGWCRKETLKSAEDLKAEGAKEYREALLKYKDMTYVQRVEAMGSDSPTPCLEDVLDCIGVAEFISKLKAYENTPKVGEIWERNCDGAKVVVMSIDERGVTYSCHSTRSNDFAADYYSLDGFKENFRNTGKTCSSLMPFLEELEGFRNE